MINKNEAAGPNSSKLLIHQQKSKNKNRESVSEDNMMQFDKNDEEEKVPPPERAQDSLRNRIEENKKAFENPSSARVLSSHSSYQISACMSEREIGGEETHKMGDNLYFR